jgi:hypothetical protein
MFSEHPWHISVGTADRKLSLTRTNFRSEDNIKMGLKKRCEDMDRTERVLGSTRIRLRTYVKTVLKL